MSNKFFSVSIIILLVLAVASPAFASDITGYDVAVYYPQPPVDEYSGWFSYKTASQVITYAWTFLPYHGSVTGGSGELGNASTYVEVDYLSSTSNFSFVLFPGFFESSNFIMYRYITDLADNSTDMQMVEYLTVNGTTTLTYSRYGAPLAYALGGAVAFMDTEFSALPAMNITFGEDSNTNYDLNLFYNYYRNLMDVLYPAISEAFADIHEIEASADALVSYQTDILHEVSAISTVITSQLMSSDPDDMRSIRDLLVEIATNTGSFSEEDISSITSNLSAISSRLTNINAALTNPSYPLMNVLNRIFSSMNEKTNSIIGILEELHSFFTMGEFTLDDSLYLCFSNFVNRIYDDEYTRDLWIELTELVLRPTVIAGTEIALDSKFPDDYGDSVLQKMDQLLAAMGADPREELDYQASEDNSMSVFTFFNDYVFAPFRSLWARISSVFVFDSGSQSSGNVISDYLFDGSRIDGLNSLDSVNWGELP